ncbi:MAG: DUF3426 domain-containing protein [Gammaproteobacteria bacterium]|nr:DUF3426 domain-containing protein [Gammaproteobacteria bacterium]
MTHHQLSAAGGRVRCGQCNAIFDGNANIMYSRPPSTAAALPQTPRSSPEDTTAPEKLSPRHTVEPATHPQAAADSPDGSVTPESPHDAEDHQLAADLPPFLYGSQPRGRRRAARYLLIIAIVLLLLAGYAYLERDRLARSPLLADWMTRACRYVGCEAPIFRAPEQIRIVDRKVASRPSRRDTLRVTATLLNQAPLAQPYPRMSIMLTNLQGTVVAINRFEPADYLPAKMTPDALMPRAGRVEIRVEIPDPGEDAVAFEFSFY